MTASTTAYYVVAAILGTCFLALVFYIAWSVFQFFQQQQQQQHGDRQAGSVASVPQLS